MLKENYEKVKENIVRACEKAWPARFLVIWPATSAQNGKKRSDALASFLLLRFR